MTKLTKFNQANCQFAKQKILEALEVLETELGLKFTTQRGTFTDREFTIKLTATVGGEEGKNDLEREEFSRWARSFGLEASDYGAIVTVRGKKYRLTKLNLRRGVRYPLECDALDGGRGIRLPLEYTLQVKAARK